MVAVLRAAGHDRKLALLNAHPDLAGRLALRGELTADSTAEQASAGLDRCTPEEFARFTELNDAYKARFGFPFILAVKGRSRADILEAFETRLSNGPEEEFATALAQVERITWLGEHRDELVHEIDGVVVKVDDRGLADGVDGQGRDERPARPGGNGGRPLRGERAGHAGLADRFPHRHGAQRRTV